MQNGEAILIVRQLQTLRETQAATVGPSKLGHEEAKAKAFEREALALRVILMMATGNVGDVTSPPTKGT